MPDLYSKLASNIATYSAMAMIVGSLCLSIKFPQFSIAGALAIGVMFAVPLFILGFRSFPQNNATGGSRSFWLTSSELWGILGLLALAGVLLLPISTIALISMLIPAGDTWPLVTLRIPVAILLVCGIVWWWKFSRTTLLESFRGKLSDQALDSYIKPKPKVPTTMWEAAVANWLSLLIGIVAAGLSTGFINLNDPIFKIDSKPRPTSGIASVLTWCRGNPKTVFSSARLTCIGAFAFYGYSILRVHLLQAKRAHSPKALDEQTS